MTINSGKSFVVNNIGTTTVKTTDCDILVENNSFDVKDTNNVSLFELIDEKITLIENILSTPVGSDNEIVTTVRQQTNIISDIEGLLN